ncbi:hypothetical protein H1235_01940 [Pseudoxanthomonas sp. NC8]|nr:hypothetical protein H1235_01940 [Pseudoxanthomonas sp. NC8]
MAGAGLTPEQLQAAQRALVETVPGAAGALLVLEPNAPGQAPYARWLGLEGRARDLHADGYDYRAQPRYRRTLAARQAGGPSPISTAPPATSG